MTSRDFVFWLQGYFEILDPAGTLEFPIGVAQAEVIRKHLGLVFKHDIAAPAPAPPLQQGDKGFRPSPLQQQQWRGQESVQPQWFFDPTTTTYC